MSSFSFVLRWLWVLSVALLIPVSLPAGGAQKNNLKIHAREYCAPVLANDSCELLASPSIMAPRLRTLQIGTPMRILRVWEGEDGKNWIHVQVASNDAIELTYSVNRGWLSV